MELRHLRSHRSAARAVNRWTARHLGARQLHAAHRLFRLGIHARALALWLERPRVREGAAHHADTCHHRGDLQPADLFGHGIYSRAHPVAGTRRARSDDLDRLSDPRTSVRTGTTAGFYRNAL